MNQFGKTITAIYGTVKVYATFKKLFVVIAVPYQSLADQWVEILTKFHIFPVKCYASSALWQKQFTQRVMLYDAGSLNFACAVVVNRTLQSDNFQHLIGQVPAANFLWQETSAIIMRVRILQEAYRKMLRCV